MQKGDWLLIYLSLPPNSDNNYISPTEINIGLFLFKMKFKKEIQPFYGFEPYLDGPSSLEIFKDLRKFQRMGLLDNRSGKLSIWDEYKLFEEGKHKVSQIINEAPRELLKELEAIKMKVTSLSFLDLLKEVYIKYPRYTKKSMINIGALDDISSRIGM